MALGFVSSAILARYFNKVDYGTYKQVIYVYSTLSTLFIIGLPSVFGYLLPRLNRGGQKKLVSTINKIFILLGLAFSLVLFSCAGILADILKNPDLKLALRIFSPFPLFTLPALGVEGIYTALRKTKYIALYTTCNKLISLIFIVTPVVFFHCSYIGALIGWGVANFIVFLLSIYMKNRPFVDVKTEIVPNMYKTIFSYCLPLVGAFFAGFAISSAGQFFVSRYYGTAAFADFSNGCLSIPIAAMIASSVKQVLVPVISKAHHEKHYSEISRTYSNACSKSMLLIFPILVFAIVFAVPLMTFVYGSIYYTSASFLRVYLIRDFCSALPYFSVLMAFGKSNLYMNLHIAGAIFVWGADACAVFILQLPAYSIVFNDSLFHILCSAVVFYYIFRKYHINLFSRELIKNIVVILFHSAAIAFAVYYLMKWLTGIIYFASIPFYNLAIGGAIYLIVLVVTGKLIKVNYLQVAGMLRRG